jgi:hypothetical protein
MRAEQAAYATLSAFSEVTALVGSRIYPDFVPMDRELPAVSMLREDTLMIATIHSGAVVAAQATIEFWCVGVNRLEAENVADATLLALTTGSPGEFYPVSRRQETDAGPPEQFATVLTMMYWELN